MFWSREVRPYSLTTTTAVSCGTNFSQFLWILMMTDPLRRGNLRAMANQAETSGAGGTALTLQDMRRTDDWSPVDVCYERLRLAGWSVADVLVETADGPAWIVTASAGPRMLRAIGQTQSEAWLQVLEQAEAAGIGAQ
jgi:hypothetical protein